MQDNEVKRGRPSRAEEIRKNRRKQRGAVEMEGKNLMVDMSKLDNENYAYRWGNDAGMRMSQLHGNDWDPAPEQASISSDGEGTINSKVAGTDATGKPFHAKLMRKPRVLFEDDKKEKLRPLNEFDSALREGTNHASHEGLGNNTYTPNGRNTIG